MKYIIFLALLCVVAFASSSPSPGKTPSTSADLVKKKYETSGSKKRDTKKVEIEEEEEEEEEEEVEEEAEEEGSEYEDEYYGKPPSFYGGIKVSLDPWKAKDEEKQFAKKEPKFTPFDFEKEKGKKHKIDEKEEGEFAYPDPKLFFPAGIYKDIPFKKADVPKEVPYLKPEIPKDIYKKEEKEHKAPTKPVYDEKKYTDIPFYGIPFLYGDGHKVHDMEDSEEEKIDPKLLYKEYLLGHHFPLTGAKIPLYTFDPTLIHELMSKDKKFKSVNLKHHPDELSESIDVKKKTHALSKDAKDATSVYKADVDAVKKSLKQ